MGGGIDMSHAYPFLDTTHQVAGDSRPPHQLQTEFRRLTWVGGTVQPSFPVPPSGQASSPAEESQPTAAPARATTSTAGLRNALSYVKVAPITDPPSSKQKVDHYRALQEWEGTVDSIGDRTFVARLVDRTSPGPDEEAEFDIDEVSRGDRDLLAPGAIFYWSIGYRDSASGSRSRTSLLTFRRLPAWTDEEKRQAEKTADEIIEVLDWNH